MASLIRADLFVEDHAHEAFLVPMLLRIAREEGVSVQPVIGRARGGRARTLSELKLYQRAIRAGTAASAASDLLIAGVDGNCSTFVAMRKEIEAATEEPYTDRLVVACPDPHVERWYLSDPPSFNEVVGSFPTVAWGKCERDYYKKILADAVREGGHPSLLGGIEFARELVAGMDLFRAGKNDRSLKAFVDDLRARLRAIGQGTGR